VGRNEDSGRVCGRCRTKYLATENLVRTPSVLGRYDGREVPPANVADKALGCRVDPPDHPRPVEHVARDAHVVEGPLDIATDSQAAGHRTK